MHRRPPSFGAPNSPWLANPMLSTDGRGGCDDDGDDDDDDAGPSVHAAARGAWDGGGGAPRGGEDDVSLVVVVVIIVVVVVVVAARLSSSRRVIVSDALLRGGDGGGCGNIARRHAPRRGAGRPRPAILRFRGRCDYDFGALVRDRDGCSSGGSRFALRRG